MYVVAPRWAAVCPPSSPMVRMQPNAVYEASFTVLYCCHMPGHFASPWPSLWVGVCPLPFVERILRSLLCVDRGMVHVLPPLVYSLVYELVGYKLLPYTPPHLRFGLVPWSWFFALSCCAVDGE